MPRPRHRSRPRKNRETAATLNGRDGWCGRCDAWEVRSGDFADVLAELAPASVDFVLADPPYTPDFEDRWADLSEACARE